MATTRRVKTAYPPFLRIAGFERDFAGLSFSAGEGDAPLWDDLTISAAGATRGILRNGDTERFEYIEASTAVSLVRHEKEGGGFNFEAMPGDAAENAPGVRKATPVGQAVHWELGDVTDLLPAAP